MSYYLFLYVSTQWNEDKRIVEWRYNFRILNFNTVCMQMVASCP